MKSSEAHQIVSKAIADGKLVPLDACQLCDTATRTVAHHWKGYAYPLEVWWICVRCNRRLHGAHNAKMSLETAKHYVALPVRPKPGSDAWKRLVKVRNP